LAKTILWGGKSIMKLDDVLKRHIDVFGISITQWIISTKPQQSTYWMFLLNDEQGIRWMVNRYIESAKKDEECLNAGQLIDLLTIEYTKFKEKVFEAAKNAHQK
jgi:hypothetical protein